MNLRVFFIKHIECHEDDEKSGREFIEWFWNKYRAADFNTLIDVNEWNKKDGKRC